MKLVKKASGKTTIKMSRAEWTNLGKKAGWMNKEANFDQLMEVMIRFEKSVDNAVMDGKDINQLLENLKVEIRKNGLEEIFQKHGAPHIEMVIERAKEKAGRYSKQGIFGLFDEGSKFNQGWVIGKDNFGDPKFGPEEHAIIYNSYGEAESAAKKFDFGLSVEEIK